MPSNDLKMEEKNPLEPIAVTLKRNSQESNKRGRPSSSKALKFTPQPKSIISRLLSRIREENCDNIKEGSLNNDSNSRENDGNFQDRIESIERKPNSYESVQGNFTLDLTTLEHDNDNFKDGCLSDDKEQDNYQMTTKTLWNKKDEEEPKLLEIVCYVCSHRSTSQKAHRKHLSTHRNQPYTCNFPNCKYSCKLSCNLIKHKRIHTSEKPYLCDQCTFRSNFANSLKVHKRIHTSDRPYCCQHCSYRCNSSSNLKKHCRHKHRNVS